MRPIANLILSLCGIAVLTLRFVAQEEPGDIGAATLSILQRSDGEVVVTLRNGSKGRIFAHRTGFVEVFEDGKWGPPRFEGSVCGDREPARQIEVQPGRVATFAMPGYAIRGVKLGHTARVQVPAWSLFKSGRVVSESFVVSRSG